MALSSKHRIPRKIVKDIIKKRSVLKFVAPLGKFVFRNNNEAYTRFSCVVGYSVSKKAPERNRIKRMVTEWLRKNGGNEFWKAGFDVILMVSGGNGLKNKHTFYSILEHSFFNFFGFIKLFAADK